MPCLRASVGRVAQLEPEREGNDSFEIGNVGESTDGSAANSGVIRIGTAGTQTKTSTAERLCLHAHSTSRKHIAGAL
jgi:hypothetical protein